LQRSDEKKIKRGRVATGTGISRHTSGLNRGPGRQTVFENRVIKADARSTPFA
jgi:hypothetical protein